MSLSNIPDRFWEKIKIMGSGCWEWQAFIMRNGYGQFKETGCRKHTSAHRFMYFTLNPEESREFYVLHKCDNTKCVNPSHLFKGTQQDNMRDKILKKRDHHQLKTHCPSGHEYNTTNSYIQVWDWGGGKRKCKICLKNRKEN